MRNKKNLAGVAALLSLLSLFGVAYADSGEQYYSGEDFYKVAKIDMHMHLHSTNPGFMQEAEHDHFRVLSINVDYADFPPLDVQRRVSETMLKNHPATFAYATTFATANFEQPGWADGVIRQIDAAVRHGAVAVKVWKNIGMSLRAADGHMVMIDDPHFKPIFDHLAKIHIPLLGHQGEPRNCWLPLNAMTVKNDQEYFTSHPQYYMYLHPDMPSYQDQIRARDHMLSQHPDLQFAGLHLASLEWSVDEIAHFLDRFPNAVVDVAARVDELEDQSNQDREKVRRFFIKYQDRIMYATDLDQEPEHTGDAAVGKEEPSFEEQTRQVWLRDWRYFTSADVFTVPELDQPVHGLSLPRAVIDKIYRKNAEHLFPAAWGGSKK